MIEHLGHYIVVVVTAHTFIRTYMVTFVYIRMIGGRDETLIKFAEV